MKVELNQVMGINALTTINSNFDKIKSELNNKVLYRDNPDGEPNTMDNSIDMDGHSIYNLGDLAVTGIFTVDGQTITEAVGAAANDVIAEVGNIDEAVTAAQAAAASATASAVIAEGFAGFAALAVLPDNSVALAKLVQVPTATIIGRKTAGVGNTEVLSPADARTVMSVSSTAEATTATKQFVKTHLRNVLGNSDFAVSQEFGNTTNTNIAGSGYGRSADMWYPSCEGASTPVQRFTDTAGVTSLRISGAVGNTGTAHTTNVEQRNSTHLAGKACTIAIRGKANVATNVNYSLYHAATNDSFGTYAAPTRVLITSGTFAFTGTMTTFVANFTNLVGATTGLELVIGTGALNVGTTVEFYNVQLEEGTLAANEVVFEKLEYSTQLATCQYAGYELITMIVQSGFAGAFAKIAEKRTIPTIGTPIFGIGTGATFALYGDALYQATVHSSFSGAQVPLYCGFH